MTAQEQREAHFATLATRAALVCSTQNFEVAADVPVADGLTDLQRAQLSFRQGISNTIPGGGTGGGVPNIVELDRRR